MVDVNDNHKKHSFCANTGMGWLVFKDRAVSQFKTNNDVHLGYCISSSGDFHRISNLGCKSNWNDAMMWMKEKVQSAQSHAVTMELKNMVSDICSA